MKTKTNILSPSVGVPVPEKFSKARHLADQIGVHPKTLHRWAAAKVINRHKLGARTVVFNVTEVLAYVASCRV